MVWMSYDEVHPDLVCVQQAADTLFFLQSRQIYMRQGTSKTVTLHLTLTSFTSCIQV